MRRLTKLIFKGYRFVISPLLGNNCRFYPSCSCYAETAILRYGLFRGFWMSLRRLSKCHPWHEGGLDPVPELNKAKTNTSTPSTKRDASWTHNV